MKKLSLLCIILTVFSCTVEDNYAPIKPEPANLIFPENNQECNKGIPISGTNKTAVTFQWQDDIHADSYAVVLKDLSTQNSSVLKSTTNELTINLEKETPYSWYVISYNAFDLETVQSTVWKFYNAGDPTTSYVPFPADAVYPVMSGVYTDIISVQLEWNGLDIDNDIINYDVYFDTVTTPTTLLANTTQNTLETPVSSGNIYYWRVVTYDAAGNNSESEIFEFRVE